MYVACRHTCILYRQPYTNTKKLTADNPTFRMREIETKERSYQEVFVLSRWWGYEAGGRVLVFSYTLISQEIPCYTCRGFPVLTSRRTDSHGKRLILPGRLISGHSHRQAGKQESRKSDEHTCRQTSWHTARQTNR